MIVLMVFPGLLFLFLVLVGDVTEFFLGFPQNCLQFFDAPFVFFIINILFFEFLGFRNIILSFFCKSKLQVLQLRLQFFVLPVLFFDLFHADVLDMQQKFILRI